MLLGYTNNGMLRGPLGLVISEDCAATSELLESRLDELGMIVGQALAVLQAVSTYAKDSSIRGRAEGLSRALWELWQPYDEIRYPDQEKEPVAKWIPQNVMDHLCAAFKKTEDLAEQSYLTEGADSSEIAVAYGDLIRLMTDLRDKYVYGKLPEKKIRPIGPIILMIAGVTGLGILASHMVAENAKLQRRRR